MLFEHTQKSGSEFMCWSISLPNDMLKVTEFIGRRKTWYELKKGKNQQINSEPNSRACNNMACSLAKNKKKIERNSEYVIIG